MFEKQISDFFDVQGLFEFQFGRVPVFESVGLDLQYIGVDLPFPEPFRTAELDIGGVYGRYLF